MNDPNGLVYYDGEYHLFYQHLPNTITNDGPKHWGHAVSENLIHWEHLPIALSPEETGEVWSGSVVVDRKNSSGFGKSGQPPLVAVFTQATEYSQHQCLASSIDRGRTWEMYPGNPVLEESGLQDFRDPKVFWYPETGCWIMVISAGKEIRIYSSANLSKWSFESEYSVIHGQPGAVCECPDMFPITIQNSHKTAWVLLVSILNPENWSETGIKYFIGRFDGHAFLPIETATTGNWYEKGSDQYAGVTFNNAPGGRRIYIGWMNGWQYAEDTPTIDWRGVMSIPREFELIRTSKVDMPHLKSLPVRELRAFHQSSWKLDEIIPLNSESMEMSPKLPHSAFDIQVTFQNRSAKQCGLILKNQLGEEYRIRYDIHSELVTTDRKKSGLTDFHSGFPKNILRPVSLIDSDLLHFRILVDTCSIELFCQGGKQVLSQLIFPEIPFSSIELFATSGETEILECSVAEMIQ